MHVLYCAVICWYWPTMPTTMGASIMHVKLVTAVLLMRMWAKENAQFFCLTHVLPDVFIPCTAVYHQGGIETKSSGNWSCHVIYVCKQAVQIPITCLVQKLDILLLETNYSQWWSAHLLKCLDLSVSVLLCVDIFLYFTCLLGFKTTSPFPVFRRVEVQQTLKQTNGQ